MGLKLALDFGFIGWVQERRPCVRCVIAENRQYGISLFQYPCFSSSSLLVKNSIHIKNRSRQNIHVFIYLRPQSCQSVMWLWRFRLVSIAVLLSVVQASSNTKSWNENIHVALHAQVSPSQGFIVGSVITTAGTTLFTT